MKNRKKDNKIGKKDRNYIYHLLLRYFAVLFLGLGNLYLFYKAFTPLTIYPVYWILSLFYQVDISGIDLYIGIYNIKFIEACIAGAAYYLLVILNFSTPMKLKKRIYSLLFVFSMFLLLNIIRIIVLSVLFINNAAFFDITHKLFWYAMSTAFVVAIWFTNVILFKIKEVPVYSDVMKIKSMIKK